MRMQVVRGPVTCGPFELHEGDNFIGRAPECEVCLPSKKVSRRHASVTVRDGRAVVKDLESHNGVVDADGRRVAVLPLPAGQKVQIGDFLLVLDGPVAEDDLDLDGEEEEEVDLEEEPVPLPKARRGPPDPGATGMSPLARPSMPPPTEKPAPKVSQRPARDVSPPAEPARPAPAPAAAVRPPPEPAPPARPAPASSPQPAAPSARPERAVKKETISLAGVTIRPPEPEEAAAAAAVAEPRAPEPIRTAAAPRVPEPQVRSEPAPAAPEAPTERQAPPPPEPATKPQSPRSYDAPAAAPPAPQADVPTRRQERPPAEVRSEPAEPRADARPPRRMADRPSAPVPLPRFEAVEVPSTGVPWALQAFLIFGFLWAVVVCAPMGGLFSQKWAADARLAQATERYAFQVGTTLAERNAQALLEGDRTLLDLSYATSVPGVVEARVADARGMVLAPDDKYRISLGSREVYQRAAATLDSAKAEAGGSTVEIVVPARRSVGGEIVGWAFMVVDLGELGSATAAPWWWWVPSVAVVFLVTVLLGVAPWWLFVRPLAALAAQADRVADTESGTLRPTARLRPLERIVFAFNGVLVQARSGRS